MSKEKVERVVLDDVRGMSSLELLSLLYGDNTEIKQARLSALVRSGFTPVNALSKRLLDISKYKQYLALRKKEARAFGRRRDMAMDKMKTLYFILTGKKWVVRAKRVNDDP